jgi:hypothetical protein
MKEQRQMSIEVTHVRFSGTSPTHESIVRYKLVEDGNSNVYEADKPTAVDWIDNKDIKAYVGSGVSRVAVGVVHPATGEPFLRTHADGDWTNNLLSLPTF